MYSARRSTQSFVPEQNYIVCTFCLADDGDVHGVHRDNEKTNLYLVQISWKQERIEGTEKASLIHTLFHR